MRKTSGWSLESRHKRGYGTAWNKLRLMVLRRDNGICQCVDCQGGKLRLTAATEVDHIKPKADGGTDDLSNLQAINKECHKKKTAREQGRTLKQQITIGIDGYPVNGAG